MYSPVYRDRPGCPEEHHSTLAPIPSGGVEVYTAVDRNRGVVGDPLEHYPLGAGGGSQVGVVRGTVAVIFGFVAGKRNHIGVYALDAKRFPITGVAKGGVCPLQIDKDYLVSHSERNPRRGWRRGLRYWR